MTLTLLLKDKNKRASINILLSFCMTFLFALFNGVMELLNHLIWNGSICVYYTLLLLIRLLIIYTEKIINDKDFKEKDKVRKIVYYISSIFLILINIVLIFPIALMVLNKKETRMGLIPAIASATYTTYKIVMSIISYNNYKNCNNILLRQIRTINLVDAFFSVLVLQNTLILATDGGYSKDMFVLSSISSFFGFIIIVALSVVSFYRINKTNKKTNNKQIANEKIKL